MTDLLSVDNACYWTGKLYDPRGRVSSLGHVHISHVVKINHFYENVVLYSGVGFRQTQCIVMMTEECSINFVKFLITGAGVLVPMCGHIS